MKILILTTDKSEESLAPLIDYLQKQYIPVEQISNWLRAIQRLQEGEEFKAILSSKTLESKRGKATFSQMVNLHTKARLTFPNTKRAMIAKKFTDNELNVLYREGIEVFTLEDGVQHKILRFCESQPAERMLQVC